MNCELHMYVYVYIFFCEIIDNAVTGAWLERAHGTMWSPAHVTAVTGALLSVQALC